MKAKLTVEQVREVTRAYLGGKTSTAQLAEAYGVWKSTIQRITCGEAWRHITEPMGLQKRAPGDWRLVRGVDNVKAKLTDDKVRRIRQLARDGVPKARIAPLMGVKKAAICAVVEGRSWKHVN